MFKSDDFLIGVFCTSTITSLILKRFINGLLLAIFNITDSTGLYVKIIYNEEESEKVEFTVGDNVIVTGKYYKSSNTHAVSDEYTIAKNLNHVIVSSSLQTKCDSKYSEDKQ